jgi:hypothetical protein
MAKAIFKYRNTGQIKTYTDAKQIARLKKHPKFILLEETKTPRTRKPTPPKEETEE